jgi:hypothetical protein
MMVTRAYLCLKGYNCYNRQKDAIYIALLYYEGFDFNSILAMSFVLSSSNALENQQSMSRVSDKSNYLHSTQQGRVHLQEQFSESFAL